MQLKQYLIIDDLGDDVEQLTMMLAKFPFYKLTGVVQTVEEAIDVMSKQHIDLIFLDIRLNGQSGLTLLKANVPLPPVIIISAYSEYAVDSYAIGKATDYLLKPISEERLHIALTRAIQMQNGTNNIVDFDAAFLKMGRRIQRFDYKAIDYIEAFGIYSKVYNGDQMDLVNERLSALTRLLPGRLFIRIHKSYLINITKITSYDRQNVWLGKTKIPIGISYRDRLDGFLMLFDTAEAGAD